MGDLPYISSEEGGGLIIRTTIYERPTLTQELRAEGGGLIRHTIRYKYRKAYMPNQKISP